MGENCCKKYLGLLLLAHDKDVTSVQIYKVSAL